MEFVKNNWKLLTSGFCLVVGTLVCVFRPEQIELGYALLGASGLPIALPLAKKAAKKKVLPLLLAGLLFFPALSCKSHMINVDMVAPAVEQVLDRHDAYVKADKSLTDLAREVYLKTTELIRKLLAEAQK